ncbi:MAG TPA: M1 family aminopeptidase [Thermoanaerobaculia bacterium]|nr:M1 family aminopeptidase [Thermoanaerobaculia bacterium]
MKALAVAALALCLPATHALAAIATYVVSYSGGKTVDVRAHLPAGDGRLLIGQGGGIDHLPAQWATFAKDIRVTTAGGMAVSVTARGAEGWSLSTGDEIDVRYSVDLAYAIETWPAGNEQSGRRFADGTLFTRTKPLFFYTSGVTDASVEFDVPKGWKVAAPWTRRGDSYEAAGVRSLTENSIVLGRFPSTELRVGNFDVTVATPGEERPPVKLAAALRQLGSEAGRLFAGTPPGRYVLTFFRAGEEDGESYESSAALTSPLPFDDASMIVTGNTVVHELLHHWFGGMIAPVEHDSIAWFTEGFTEYYANVMLSRSGAVPPRLMRAKLTNMASGYLYFMNSSLFKGVTLADAVQKKGAYRFGVYNGGWAVALSLDVMLRSESQGKRSLDDVVRLLFTRFGQTGTPIAEKDIIAAASEVAGRDLQPFFDRYVHARNDLPLAETLQKLGLELRGQPYAGDMYLVEVPTPSAAQRALRTSLLGAE